MAEILQHEHKQKAGVHKTKKANLRIDLTPMVDLGFLLISFFVFTTTLAKPTAMHLAIPDDSLNQMTNIGAKKLDLRSVIISKKNKLKNYFGSDTSLIVLIKPTKNATYANIVNALDEMVINEVKTYVLMDVSIEESDKINQ